MENFKVGNPDDWVKVEESKVYTFAGSAKGRSIAVDFIGNATFEVWGGAIGQSPILLAVGRGRFAIEVADKRGIALFVTQRDGDVFMRTLTRGQTVDPVSFDVLTSVERRSTMNPELARIMQYVKLNQQANDTALAAERNERRKLEERFRLRAEKAEKGDKVVESAKPDATGKGGKSVKGDGGEGDVIEADGGDDAES